MKNKLKALLALFVGVFAFSVIGVSTKAATVDFGTVLVKNTVYTGDTKVWDFTENLPKSNTNIPVGDDINGIVSSKDGTSNKVTKINSDSGTAYVTFAGAEFLVPVPSASSIGTVTRTGNGNSKRYLALGSNAAVKLTESMTFNFTTSDIETNPTLSDGNTIEGYYLRFIVSGGEAKTTGITVQLTDGKSTYVSATFEAQYNAASDVNSTKLRFIGTIQDVSYADYAKISSVQFKFTFKGEDRTGNVANLYKSINNGGAVFKPAAENTMYVVYTLNNINKTEYNGLTLSNLQLVITFSDGPTTIVSHDDITLPTFA